MIFQKTPSKCGCPLCGAGCLCGDCSGCTNAVSERAFLRNAKRASMLCCLILVVGGFLFFAPVVSLNSAPPVTTGVLSLKIDTTKTSTGALCSITFCYFGQGAVYAQGIYYPMTKPAHDGLLGYRRDQQHEIPFTTLEPHSLGFVRP